MERAATTRPLLAHLPLANLEVPLTDAAACWSCSVCGWERWTPEAHSRLNAPCQVCGTAREFWAVNEMDAVSAANGGNHE